MSSDLGAAGFPLRFSPLVQAVRVRDRRPLGHQRMVGARPSRGEINPDRADDLVAGREWGLRAPCVYAGIGPSTALPEPRTSLNPLINVVEAKGRCRTRHRRARGGVGSPTSRAGSIARAGCTCSRTATRSSPRRTRGIGKTTTHRLSTPDPTRQGNSADHTLKPGDQPDDTRASVSPHAARCTLRDYAVKQLWPIGFKKANAALDMPVLLLAVCPTPVEVEPDVNDCRRLCDTADIVAYDSRACDRVALDGWRDRR